MRPIDIRIQEKKDANTPLFPEYGDVNPTELELEAVGILEGGMVSGLPSLMLISEDGKFFMQISFGQWDTITGALTGAMSRWRHRDGN